MQEQLEQANNITITHLQPGNIEWIHKGKEMRINGAMFDVEKYFERGSLVSSNMYGIEVSELMVQDIDNEVDWKLAELKYSLMLKDNNIKDEY